MSDLRAPPTDFRRRYGPWALIAGASEGLGEAFADALAGRGLRLILLARREAKLRATAEAIAERHEVEVVSVACDLADPELEARVRAGIGEREVGLLIYNAAYSRMGEFFGQSLADKLRTIDVNCRGPLILSHVIGESMLARGRGGIVLMGSLAGEGGSPRLATYAASKAFNRVLAESLWGELRTRGIDVLACVAGATRTPGFEAVASTARGPVMEPAAVVAEALAKLGRTPSMVPGLGNRIGALLLGQMPARLRVQIMDLATRGGGGSRED